MIKNVLLNGKYTFIFIGLINLNLGFRAKECGFGVRFIFFSKKKKILKIGSIFFSNFEKKI